jgi:hypothetical protein
MLIYISPNFPCVTKLSSHFLPLCSQKLGLHVTWTLRFLRNFWNLIWATRFGPNISTLKSCVFYVCFCPCHKVSGCLLLSQGIRYALGFFLGQTYSAVRFCILNKNVVYTSRCRGGAPFPFSKKKTTKTTKSDMKAAFKLVELDYGLILESANRNYTLDFWTGLLPPCARCTMQEMGKNSRPRQ